MAELFERVYPAAKSIPEPLLEDRFVVAREPDGRFAVGRTSPNGRVGVILLNRDELAQVQKLIEVALTAEASR